ncbi:uncharacterized protein F5891DRAFT_1151914 [Suillus fuscotomentosus]|uniref:Uncharacterized protein n=1 Tax=Suillus fuscotomentosus TaxID=1912939 RepID=A0AAD4DVF5_9AGAM|nr:uncharacterized protein F5891DRAFT_1151914 [Suillus fuscotomentosus]KAG1894803.1 hypothetical protein F5891DRAFT_1151914 [Suillus fuscotomentosus]
MPLTSKELATLTKDTPTNLPLLPGFIARSSLPDPPTRTPSPHPSEALTPNQSANCAGPLREGNSSTWAARNPTRPVIRPRTPPPRLTDAQKASRKIKRDQKREATKSLHDGISEYLDEQRVKIEVLARTHNVTPKHINDIISVHTNYHNSRKPRLINALIHAKAKELNADKPAGSHYTLAELREMVTNDPQMNKLTEEEKASYIEALNEHRDKKALGVCANNSAAARDVVATTERLVKELDDLRVRTGIYATLFVVRGHINDTIQSTMHGTDNTEDFWEDVYEHPMADFLRQYEQWACTQDQNLNERESLEAMRKQVRKMIFRGLFAVTGKKDIAMNYHNYETAIVETYGVRLVGWPHGVNFISPSNIGTVGDIRKLRDALKSCICYWTVLSPEEVKSHAAELNTRRLAGEIVRKPRKKRSDSGVPRKRKAPATAGQAGQENQRVSKKAKRTAPQLRQAPKSSEVVESSDGLEDE